MKRSLVQSVKRYSHDMRIHESSLFKFATKSLSFFFLPTNIQGSKLLIKEIT